MPQPLKPERRGSQATAWLALAALLLLLCVGSVSLVPGRTALFKSQRSRSDAWMGDGLRRHNALSAAAVPTCLTKPGRCTELLEPEEREALDRLQAWEFALPQDALARGAPLRGDTSRLRRLLRRALRGQPLSIFAAGGSVTFGMGARRDGEQGYVDQFMRFLNATFPPRGGRAHNVTNGGRNAFTSSSYEMCARRLLDPTADLYILEFAANDYTTQDACLLSQPDMWALPQRRAYERLMRRILTLPQRPVLLLLSHYSISGDTGGGRGNYYRTAENDYNVLAAYYGVTSLSLRTAVWPLMQANISGYRVDLPTDCLPSDRPIPSYCAVHRTSITARGGDPDAINPKSQLFADQVHPAAATGHRYLSELLIHSLQLAASELLLEVAMGQAPQQLHPRGLPLPMLPGNEVRQHEQCYVQDMLKELAVKSQGWQWVDDGANGTGVHKWGWASDTPGANLVLQLDTQFSSSKEDALARVEVWLSLVHSWQGAGIVRVSCVSGCSCDTKFHDLHWGRQATQPEVIIVQVSQGSKCRMGLEVVKRTSSGGRRAKLAAVMASPPMSVGDSRREAGNALQTALGV